jgi:hypothetical protein
VATKPPSVEEFDGVPLTGEQLQMLREARRAGLHVRHSLTQAEEEELSTRLRHFDELSASEQEAELDRADSPWQGYLWEYDGFGLTVLGRVTPLRAPGPRPLMRSPQRARPRARATRPRRRRSAGGSRDRPRLADDDEADLARVARREVAA